MARKRPSDARSDVPDRSRANTVIGIVARGGKPAPSVIWSRYSQNSRAGGAHAEGREAAAGICIRSDRRKTPIDLDRRTDRVGAAHAVKDMLLVDQIDCGTDDARRSAISCDARKPDELRRLPHSHRTKVEGVGEGEDRNVCSHPKSKRDDCDPCESRRLSEDASGVT